MIPVVAVVLTCPECGEQIRKRKRHYDDREFLGCTGYPKCKWTAPAHVEIKALAERVSALEIENRRLTQLLEAARGAA